MTSERRNMWLGIAVVAAAQIAVLAWMVWDRVHLLSTGREIVLEVVPVDPRDLFRGDYVILNYDISRVPILIFKERLPRGSVIFATLQKAKDGKWRVYAADPERPKSVGPDQVVLKGRVRYASGPRFASVRYGIESFFVPEGTGRELEKLRGKKKLAALIAVDESGNAAIKGLIVDGERVYEEPLF
ncbi:MAG: GDYXXLXY domain-containing protein [Hyphomicrobium sp.]